MKKIFFCVFILFSNFVNALEFNLSRLEDCIPVLDVNREAKKEDCIPALDVNGKIETGDPLIFLRNMNEWSKKGIKIKDLLLDSPGGDVNAALTISQYVLNNDINVHVLNNKTCASSCFMILAAGNRKFLDKNSHIGIHRISFNNMETTETIPLSVDMGDYYSSLNIPQEIINKMLRTKANDIHWLDYEDKQLISKLKPNKKKSNEVLDDVGIKLPSPTVNEKTRKIARNLNDQVLDLKNESPEFHISAIKILELAKELSPTDPEILANLGYYYYTYNNKEEVFLKKAEENILASIAIHNQRAISYKNLGEIYWYQKNMKKSKEAFDKYIEKSGNREKAIRNIQNFGITNGIENILDILSLE